MGAFKNCVNLFVTLFAMTGLSFGSYHFCNWYGCNGWLSFMRTDLICNACVDIGYHLKNYQISLYGSVLTLVSYQFSKLINKASFDSDKYIFEEYDLGKKSPRKLKQVNN